MTGAHAVLAISLGAITGAPSRYGPSLAMNPLVPHIPMGTLASNLIAAYIVGAAIALFAAMPGHSPHWRLRPHRPQGGRRVSARRLSGPADAPSERVRRPPAPRPRPGLGRRLPRRAWRPGAWR